MRFILARLGGFFIRTGIGIKGEVVSQFFLAKSVTLDSNGSRPRARSLWWDGTRKYI